MIAPADDPAPLGALEVAAQLVEVDLAEVGEHGGRGQHQERALGGAAPGDAAELDERRLFGADGLRGRRAQVVGLEVHGLHRLAQRRTEGRLLQVRQHRRGLLAAERGDGRPQRPFLSDDHGRRRQELGPVARQLGGVGGHGGAGELAQLDDLPGHHEHARLELQVGDVDAGEHGQGAPGPLEQGIRDGVGGELGERRPRGPEHEQRVADRRLPRGHDLGSGDAGAAGEQRQEGLVLDGRRPAEGEIRPGVAVPQHAPEPAQELVVRGVAAVHLDEQPVARVQPDDARGLEVVGGQPVGGDPELAERRRDVVDARAAGRGAEQQPAAGSGGGARERGGQDGAGRGRLPAGHRQGAEHQKPIAEPSRGPHQVAVQRQQERGGEGQPGLRERGVAGVPAQRGVEIRPGAGGDAGRDGTDEHREADGERGLQQHPPALPVGGGQDQDHQPHDERGDEQAPHRVEPARQRPDEGDQRLLERLRRLGRRQEAEDDQRRHEGQDVRGPTHLLLAGRRGEQAEAGRARARRPQESRPGLGERRPLATCRQRSCGGGDVDDPGVDAPDQGHGHADRDRVGDPGEEQASDDAVQADQAPSMVWGR